jgi:chloramphenicol-sensitive protein RarD
MNPSDSASPSTPASPSTAILLGLGANVIWGLAALYWIQTHPVAAIDVMAHRGLWTLPVMAVVLFVSGQFTQTLRFLRQPKTMALIGLTAALISTNWITFLYAVATGRAAEASFGYFLMPLLTVFAGVVVFRERITRAQSFALVMAFLAISVQVFALGQFPIISLLLSVSFVSYGVLRKAVEANAIQGLFLESLVLAPFAAIWIVLGDGAGLGQHGLRVDLFLLGTGAFTALPLVIHVASARLLPLSTVGLLSYVGPSLQLFVALTFLGETVTTLTMVAFGTVWVGLLLTGFENWRAARKTENIL